MQAIQLQRHGGPEVLELVDIPTPNPAAGQVLVQVHTIGVGKPDVLVRTGLYPWNKTLPVVLGHEMVGHVVALGEGVRGIDIGQAVLVIRPSGGGYAEYAAVSARALMPLPAGMDVERAVGALDYLGDASRGCRAAARPDSLLQRSVGRRGHGHHPAREAGWSDDHRGRKQRSQVRVCARARSPPHRRLLV